MAAIQIDESRLDAFMGQFVGDLGAALSVATVMIGDRLGLYKAMADSAPVTPAELAGRTDTDERYVREWLSSQAAGGYVNYDADSGRFTLSPEQAMAPAREDSPAFVHGASIESARAAAARAGVADRVSFEVASAKDFPGSGYDLVAMFDCLHDMGDPVGAAGHARDALHEDGTWLIVEPYANDRLEDNLNPVGRVFYSASTMVCTPASRDQEVGLALGAQAGEARLHDVVREGGFRRFRRAAETPFNLVLEARP